MQIANNDEIYCHPPQLRWVLLCVEENDAIQCEMMMKDYQSRRDIRVLGLHPPETRAGCITGCQCARYSFLLYLESHLTSPFSVISANCSCMSIKLIPQILYHGKTDESFGSHSGCLDACMPVCLVSPMGPTFTLPIASLKQCVPLHFGYISYR